MSSKNYLLNKRLYRDFKITIQPKRKKERIQQHKCRWIIGSISLMGLLYNLMTLMISTTLGTLTA